MQVLKTRFFKNALFKTIYPNGCQKKSAHLKREDIFFNKFHLLAIIWTLIIANIWTLIKIFTMQDR